ncbi:hypothetical protein [Streptomyces beihaiensis]|uniref:hypothetical protein n=1 Tax=Streptomyces beihaiensis TaxID=2984495 RepID=UPI002B1CAFC8|nr:hypothetical protein [Streptomyces beihaiensis]
MRIRCAAPANSGRSGPPLPASAADLRRTLRTGRYSRLRAIRGKGIGIAFLRDYGVPRIPRLLLDEDEDEREMSACDRADRRVATATFRVSASRCPAPPRPPLAWFSPPLLDGPLPDGSQASGLPGLRPVSPADRLARSEASSETRVHRSVTAAACAGSADVRWLGTTWARSLGGGGCRGGGVRPAARRVLRRTEVTSADANAAAATASWPALR